MTVETCHSGLHLEIQTTCRCIWNLLEASGSPKNLTKYKQTPVVPSGNLQFDIENGHRNSGFSHSKWVDLSIAMLVYQRVPGNTRTALESDISSAPSRRSDNCVCRRSASATFGWKFGQPTNVFLPNGCV